MEPPCRSASGFPSCLRYPWHERRVGRDLSQDQALFDKLSADENFAHKVLKVNATPTFFINAERIKGAISFEEFDKRIKQLLMK